MMSEANKELVRRHFEELFNRRNLAAADELMAKDYLGPLNGVVPPTGRRFAARQSHWFRVADAKLVEHWATREDLVAMLQLGVVQPPGPPPS
jgi:predicted SnoaL-like aldol condensation-catalyzing enzyme